MFTIENFRENVEKHGNAPDIEILEFKNFRSSCKVYCKRCGSSFSVSPKNLYQGRCCDACSKRKKGSLLIERPDLIQFLVNKEDSSITTGSEKEILWKCPSCGIEWKKKVLQMCKRKNPCLFCNRNMSYPNKLMFFILRQLNVDFIPEKTFSWGKSNKNYKFRYDFYLPNFSTIIEMQGVQHGKVVPNFGGSDGFLKRVQDDAIKEYLAINNGIKHYIKIDCFKSEFNYIYENIKKSFLNTIIDFNKINELDIKINIAKSDQFIACINEYNKNPKTIYALSVNLDIDKHIVKRYMALASKAGLCKYSTDIGKSLRKDSNGMSTPVEQFNIFGEFIKKYSSALEAGRMTKIDSSSISHCARCDVVTSGGYIWRYTDRDYPYTIDELVLKIKTGNIPCRHRPVFQFDFNNNLIERYQSVKVAIEKTGIKGISSAACGFCESAGGYIWKYSDV